MDSLQSILGSRDFKPPSEMDAIRDYIKRRYKSSCKIQLQRDSIIVTVATSALAATLHLERRGLIAACNLNKKLIIRISG